MGKKTQEKMKEIHCNKCGKYFFINKTTNNSRIRCPGCGSNESLSIPFGGVPMSIPAKSTKEFIPKPIREYLEEISQDRAKLAKLPAFKVKEEQ